MRRLEPGDYRRMPWANGLGMTSEIVRRDGPDGALDWRVSVADVASDGPFSVFPGYDRVIVTIGGAGMVLRQGPTVRLGPLEPHAFDGGAETHCSLVGGPVRDFNLITRRATVVAGLHVIRLAVAGDAGPLPDSTALLHCVAGRCRAGAGADRLDLVAGETALCDEGAPGLRWVAGDQGPAIAIAVTIARPGSPDHQPSRASAPHTTNRAR